MTAKKELTDIILKATEKDTSTVIATVKIIAYKDMYLRREYNVKKKLELPKSKDLSILGALVEAVIRKDFDLKEEVCEIVLLDFSQGDAS